MVLIRRLGRYLLSLQILQNALVHFNLLVGISELLFLLLQILTGTLGPLHRSTHLHLLLTNLLRELLILPLEGFD